MDNQIQNVDVLLQVGTVVDNAADFYHNRVPRKDRKKTLVDELMQDANFQRFYLLLRLVLRILSLIIFLFAGTTSVSTPTSFKPSRRYLQVHKVNHAE